MSNPQQLDFDFYTAQWQKVANETQEELLTKKSAVKELQALEETLEDLPTHLTVDAMVPFGKAAFFPGRLVHTNEITVLLGDNQYAEMPAARAKDIASRRRKHIEEDVAVLQRTLHNLALRKDISQDIAKDTEMAKMFGEEMVFDKEPPLPDEGGTEVHGRDTSEGDKRQPNLSGGDVPYEDDDDDDDDDVAAVRRGGSSVKGKRASKKQQQKEKEKEKQKQRKERQRLAVLRATRRVAAQAQDSKPSPEVPPASAASATVGPSSSASTASPSSSSSSSLFASLAQGKTPANKRLASRKHSATARAIIIDDDDDDDEDGDFFAPASVAGAGDGDRPALRRSRRQRRPPPPRSIDDDDDDDDDDDEFVGLRRRRLGRCGGCGCRVAKGQVLCVPCLRHSKRDKTNDNDDGDVDNDDYDGDDNGDDATYTPPRRRDQRAAATKCSTSTRSSRSSNSGGGRRGSAAAKQGGGGGGVSSKARQTPTRRSRTAGAKGSKRAATGSLLHELRGGSLISLQDMCVRFLVKHIDCVTDFGDIADDALDRICAVICKQNKLTDATLKLFVRPSRQHLQLFDCANLSPQSYHDLFVTCGALSTLALDLCGQIDDDRLLMLPRCSPLVSDLQLTGAFKATDAVMAAVISELKLRRFAFSSSNTLADKTLIALSKQQGLEELELKQCLKISDAEVAPLSSLRNLTRLSLVQCELITDRGLVAVLETVGPKLTHLNVHGLAQVTDRAVLTIARKCSRLHELNVAHLPDITDEGVVALADGCKQLRSLNFARCVELTDGSVGKVLTANPRLTHLSLHSLDKLSLDLLAPLCSLVHLQHLDVSLCRNLDVSDEFVDRLLKHCPDLQQVTAWACLRLTESSLRPRPSHPSFTLVGCATIV